MRGTRLYEHRHATSGAHGHHEGEGEVQVGAHGSGRGQDAELVHRDEELDAGEGAYREDLRVGEVDELEDAIDHCVAERDRGVDEAEGDTIDEDLGKVDEGGGDNVDALRFNEELVGPRTPAQEGQHEHQRGEDGSGADDEHGHPAEGHYYLPQGLQTQGPSHETSEKR